MMIREWEFRLPAPRGLQKLSVWGFRGFGRRQIAFRARGLRPISTGFSLGEHGLLETWVRSRARQFPERPLFLVRQSGRAFPVTVYEAPPRAPALRLYRVECAGIVAYAVAGDNAQAWRLVRGLIPDLPRAQAAVEVGPDGDPLPPGCARALVGRDPAERALLDACRRHWKSPAGSPPAPAAP